jgi:hypothetical protein
MINFRLSSVFLSGLFALTLHAAEPAGVTADVITDVIKYTVQPGDTVSGLSERYLNGRGRWAAIKRVNPGLDIHKLRPGQTLYLPGNRVLSVDKTAKVLKINGQAQSEGVDLQEGQQLSAGTVIHVAADSFVTLQLNDGSILVVEPNTRARLDELSQMSTGAPRSSIHIDHGRINIKAPSQTEPGARFEISTPSATTAVRGTQFRVGEKDDGTTVVEVDKGLVHVATTETDKSVFVPAGNGSIVVAGQAPDVKPLLPAPDLSKLPEKYTQTILEIDFPPVTDAVAYRVTIARDAAFADVVAAAENTLPQLKVAGLSDGKYYLHARAISADGLHGLDNGNTFLLHARPEPPFASSPIFGKHVATGSVMLMWTAPENVTAYDIHITRDGQSLPRIERHPVSSYLLEAVPGQYQWQLASRDANDHLGPFGQWSTFTVVEPPRALTAQAHLAGDNNTLTLVWAGAPDQTYHWQLASTSDFSSIEKEGDSAKSSIELPTPSAGTYFVRIRAITSDGIEGPYSSAQKLVIPEKEGNFPLWIVPLLLPFLAL